MLGIRSSGVMGLIMIVSACRRPDTGFQVSSAMSMCRAIQNRGRIRVCLHIFHRRCFRRCKELVWWDLEIQLLPIYFQF